MAEYSDDYDLGYITSREATSKYFCEKDVQYPSMNTGKSMCPWKTVE